MNADSNKLIYALLLALTISVGHIHWLTVSREPVQPVVLETIKVVEKIVEMSEPLEEERVDPKETLSAYQRGLEPGFETPDTWNRNREQGVMLARLFASELRGVLGPKALKWYEQRGTLTVGCYMLTQVVLNSKKNVLVKETRLPVPGWMGVMQELSPRGTGKYPPRRARQEWTSSLPSYGDQAPAGWVTERDGDWRMFAASWVQLRKLAVYMWQHPHLTAFPVPGGGRPRAWDMVGYESTRKRLCKLDDGTGKPLEAGGNWFWGYKGDPACLVEVIEVAQVQQKTPQ